MATSHVLSIALFILAGVCEIGGGYLLWLWFREGKPIGYAIAGAVVTTTRDPGFDFEAGLRALAGDYDTQQYSGYVSGPLVDDQLAGRLVADQRTQESFVDGFESFPPHGGASRALSYATPIVQRRCRTHAARGLGSRRWHGRRPEPLAGARSRLERD